MSFKNDLNSINEELLIVPSDHVQAKLQAQKIDQMFGYKCEEIERNLHVAHQKYFTNPEKQLWHGLDLQSMQTPYSEMVAMIKHFDPASQDIWVDLGAAYGRMGLVLGILRPGVRFIGYEFVLERVLEAQRIYQQWHVSLSTMTCIDLATEDFILPKADVYFIYDFGSKKDVFAVLEKLRLQAQKNSISVIGRGRGIKNWILLECPWLHEIVAPEHFLNWSVFRS
jgi:hypothetical protein